MSHQAALEKSLLQILNAGDDLRDAIIECAKLMRDCSCQDRRAFEALHAIAMCERAMEHWNSSVAHMRMLCEAIEKSIQ